MKKIILYLAIFGLLLFPMVTHAQEFNTMNLEEALTQEEIEHDLKNYKETDDQAIIYLFRGYGCGFCKRFLTFLNSIVDEYGKYFRVVSYETWNDANNKALLSAVGTHLNEEITGVPFIIIGDKTFAGYASDWDEDIKNAIMVEYENKNANDIMKEIGDIDLSDLPSTTNPSDTTKPGNSYSSTAQDENLSKKNNIILLTLVPLVIIGVGVFLFVSLKTDKEQAKE